MNIAPLVAQQVFIMLVLIFTGFVLSKKNVITKNGSKDISGILLSVVTPCVMIKAYQIDYTPEIAKELGLAFLLSLLIHVIFIAFSYVICRFEQNREKRIIDIFTCIYSNCGFMGIPLLEATMGDKGVLLGSAYLAIFNVLVWTHGLFHYGGSIKLLSAKNLIKNPGVIGVAAALVLFFLRVRIEGPIMDIVGYFASLNTPLAMLLLGTYLARAELKTALKQPGMYVVTFVRLIFLPIAAMVFLKLLGIEAFLATTLILSASCPVAAISAIFAEKFDMDTGYPSQIVSVTTLLSLATLPLMSLIASIII
ncbi:MAG: AEC family transporter [Clostridia bacterium]|nr:AEC family transporter [Clostridia bacterium]